ncbi:MAG: MFS transporter, partial [Desulfatiglandales bacterium]
MMDRRRGSEGGNKVFYQRLPKGIWALGFVSMFTDISSELVHSLLPIFITTTLGASMVTLGILEGLGEATSSVAKVFSGLISDYFRRRKYLVVVGYGLAVLSKPLFPLARSMGWVFTARFLDRIGKGIRVAPRDALVSELAPPDLWGAAYGLRQALDSVGAFLGPLLALVLMSSFSDNIRAVLWVAVIPGLISICLLIFGVKEPESRKGIDGSKSRISLKDTKRLGLKYWLVIALGGIFALARFSEAFLIMRGQDLGMAVGYVPVIMVVMNVTYSLFAYPAGAAADRFSAPTLLLFGLMVLVFSDIVLAAASSPVLALVGSG